MAGVINIALIPYHSVAASSVINTPTQAFETEVNAHLGGTNYRHLTTEIDSEATTDVSAPVAPGTAQATLQNRVTQILLVLDKMMDGATGGTGWVTKYGALSANANLTNLYAILNARTPLATPSTTMSRDASGNTAAATFTGALAGNAATATNVAASGITGTVAAAQIDAAIARTANVPTNAGTGATGSWGISVTGSAGSVAASNITGTVAAAQIDAAIARAANVPTNSGGGATGTWGISISGNAATATTVPDGALSSDKLLMGRVTAKAMPSLLVDIAAFTDYNLAGQRVVFPGVVGFDLASHVPAVTGNRRYVLLYVNSTAAAGVKDGALDPTSPVEPDADPDTVPLAAINLQYGQTTIDQSQILNRRSFLRRVGTAAGSGGIAVDAPVVTYASYGTTTKELDIMAWHEGTNTSPDGTTDVSVRYIIPSRLKGDANSASFADLFTNQLGGGLLVSPGSQWSFSGGALTLISSGSNKNSLEIQGKTYTNAANVTSNAASGVSAQWAVFAVPSGAGFALQLVATPFTTPNGGNARQIGWVYWYSTTSALLTTMDTKQMASIPIRSVQTETAGFVITSGGTLSATGGPAIVPNQTFAAMNNPTSTNNPVLITGYLRVSGTMSGYVFVQGMKRLNNGAWGAAGTVVAMFQAASGTFDVSLPFATTANCNPGFNEFGLGAYVTSGSVTIIGGSGSIVPLGSL